jgi:hypothetical protein
MGLTYELLYHLNSGHVKLLRYRLRSHFKTSKLAQHVVINRFKMLIYSHVNCALLRASCPTLLWGQLGACEKIPPRLRVLLNMSSGGAGPPISGHVGPATLPDIGTPAPCQARPGAPSLRVGNYSQALSCSNSLLAILSHRFMPCLALT